MKAVAFVIVCNLSVIGVAQGVAGADSKTPASPSDSTEPPAAVPSRPTVTNTALLPPLGYLQFEQGFVQANGSPGLDRQFSVVGIAKITLIPRFQFSVASQPIAHTRFSPSADSNDTGDLLVGGQVLLSSRDETKTKRPSIGVSFNRRVRSGTAADLDIGSTPQGAILLLSGRLFGLHYDSNVLVNEQTSGPVRRAQFGQTLSLNRQITPAFSLSGELFHFTQPLVFNTRHGTPNARSNTVGLLGAAGYTLRPNLVLDGGLERGLTSTSTDWQGFAGFTYLLPHRLWPARK